MANNSKNASSVFLDFLDYSTSDHRILSRRMKNRDRLLRYAILASPESTYYFATPAAAKCDDSVYLLSHYEDFWRHGRLRYVLDAKHTGSPRSYFNSRLAKLESALDEIELRKHFEYQGYKSNTWSIFFEQYLPKTLRGLSVHADKTLDGDVAFRSAAQRLMVSDGFASTLRDNGLSAAENTIQRIDEMARDTSQLFQRDHIASTLMAEQRICNFQQLDILNAMLDRAFSISNIESSGISSKAPLLDGRTLSYVSRHIYLKQGTLSQAIESMSPETVTELSYQSEWRLFIQSLTHELSHMDLIIKSQEHRLIPEIQHLLPGKYYSVLQAICSMIVAYTISPVFESGSATRTRALSAVFTDSPAWIMAILNCFTVHELTAHVRAVAQKIPKLSTYGSRQAVQPLASFGLMFDPTSGFRDIKA